MCHVVSARGGVCRVSVRLFWPKVSLRVPWSQVGRRGFMCLSNHFLGSNSRPRLINCDGSHLRLPILPTPQIYVLRATPATRNHNI